MSDPARKFIMKSEEPLMKAEAGAYALVMLIAVARAYGRSRDTFSSSGPTCRRSLRVRLKIR